MEAAASSESCRVVRRHERVNKVRRFPRVVCPATIYKPGEYAFVRDPKKAMELKAEYEKGHLIPDIPLSHKLAKMQIELEKNGESSRMTFTPYLQKQIDEARQAMNHPPLISAGKPIETMVENLYLEASSSTAFVKL